MKKVGIISDTHGYIDQRILDHFADVDEIWHAGDIGIPEVSDKLASLKPFRAVYGNIDGAEIRRIYPLNQLFEFEGIKVFITHIGGYPGRYDARVKAIIKAEKPDLYICGHSHICKVMRDQENNLLHINPGAAGIHGFHQMRTIVTLHIEKGKMKDLKVIELGKRGDLSK